MTALDHPSDVVARRVQEVRQSRGWSAQRLAERCAEIGAPHLTAAVVANIETGRRDGEGRRRRDITVDELLAFAAALGVAPLHLAIPPTGAEPYAVTPGIVVEPSSARAWVRGEEPLLGTDARTFRTQAPADEFVAPPGTFARVQEALARVQEEQQSMRQLLTTLLLERVDLPEAAEIAAEGAKIAAARSARRTADS
ncbi:MAG TPA: helix-turn-helix transcriptional regulator [Kineosporiaceae bacterium]|nr:helix-turn-helix transcriptional regulator [Kineosporiaceae bacterium]